MMKNLQFLKMCYDKGFPYCRVTDFFDQPVRDLHRQQFTGKLVSDSGTAVAGASVRVKGSKKGTPYPGRWFFYHHAAPGAILEFSAIGYTSFEAKAGSNTDYRMIDKPE